jgi:hypothetical protein
LSGNFPDLDGGPEVLAGPSDAGADPEGKAIGPMLGRMKPLRSLRQRNGVMLTTAMESEDRFTTTHRARLA